MLHLIIFSYNRASQLAVLLDSITHHVQGDYVCTVIYNSSDPFFERGYIALQESYSNRHFTGSPLFSVGGVNGFPPE
jgi:hypothetical protein